MDRHVMSATSEDPPSATNAGSARPPILNIANILTFFRLLLVPVFVAALVVHGGHTIGWRLVALVIFLFAAITDHFDGELARRHGIVTDFGKIADPIADKALIGAALITLSLLGDLPWWATVLIIVREVGITFLRFWVIKQGVIAANFGGKAKTVAQIFAIGLYLLPLPEYPAIVVLRWAALSLALILTVSSGIDYVLHAVRQRS